MKIITVLSSSSLHTTFFYLGEEEGSQRTPQGIELFIPGIEFYGINGLEI